MDKQDKTAPLNTQPSHLNRKILLHSGHLHWIVFLTHKKTWQLQGCMLKVKIKWEQFHYMLKKTKQKRYNEKAPCSNKELETNAEHLIAMFLKKSNISSNILLSSSSSSPLFNFITLLQASKQTN